MCVISSWSLVKFMNQSYFIRKARVCSGVGMRRIRRGWRPPTKHSLSVMVVPEVR